MNLNEEEYENPLDCMIDTWNNLRFEFKDDEEDECTISEVFKMKMKMIGKLKTNLN